jgi:GNAT superfamily N-acetyltransferase
MQRLGRPQGFTFELVEREEMGALYAHEGFWNALQYDLTHPRPDVLATVAREDGKVVGIAGASEDCASLWQVGMDVLPESRNSGVAAYLVNWLTHEILDRNLVPYYGTASSNIASQRVAHRSGYMPAWVCAYQGLFEGYELSTSG